MRQRRLMALVLVAALTVGHVATLQVIGWAGMLLSRVASMSWSEAVHSTFSGTRPCPICRAVQALKAHAAADHAADAAGKTVPKPGKVRGAGGDLWLAASEALMPSATGSRPWPWRLVALRLPRSTRLGPEPPPPRRSA